MTLAPLRTAIALVALSTVALTAGAQSAVRISVVDSAGRPVGGADVLVLEGLAKTIARGVTDSLGLRVLAVPARGDYQIVVRRLGFARASRYFTAEEGVLAVRIALTQMPASLAAMEVTAAANRRKAAYHLGADEIAASDRNLVDGFDVIRKLRPAIIDSYVPTSVVAGRVIEPCSIQDIWVNGQRITLVPRDERLTMMKRQNAAAQSAMQPPSAGTSVSPRARSGIGSVPVTVLSVLASIRPEHIDEVSYADCGDFSVDRPHGRNAVFVVLKEGVHFLPGVGSFVDHATLAIAPNRMRIVGVFDEASGAPVVGAEIADSASGTFVRTSETGTATLAFLPDGPHTLTLRRGGYAELALRVMLSERDTLPITVTLAAIRRN